MIKVYVNRKNNFIKEIRLSGHAKYDLYGKDIVCAGVSTALTVTVNACLMFDKQSIQYIEGNEFVLKNVKEDDITNKLLDNLYNTVKDIESEYKKYILIKEE